jgi:hypothetical protein
MGLALLRPLRLVQFWVPWGIGVCHLNPIWDEMKPVDLTTRARKKKKPRRWSDGLSSSFVWCLCAMALYPNEDRLLAPGICVNGTCHHKLPDEPIACAI